MSSRKKTLKSQRGGIINTSKIDNVNIDKKVYSIKKNT